MWAKDDDDPNLKLTDDVIVFRIRLCHLRLTHSYHLKDKRQPGCIFYDCPLTILHIFLECFDTFHVLD